jgi:hypothetical protein
MPYTEKKIEKVYYEIGEVRQIINTRLGLKGRKAVNTSAIRYYGTVHDSLQASHKSRNGTRKYKKVDIDNIVRFIRVMKTGLFTIPGGIAIVTGKMEVSINELSTPID